MSTGGPLHGVRVVELAGLAPTPFGGMLLADLGAEVLRIERTSAAGLDLPDGPMDRGKHTLPLDLANDTDRKTLYAATGEADVFIEGFRPGVAERLGVGPDDLIARNERLIYGRLTGWGQHGPLARSAGHDINYIGLSGVLDLVGRPDERPVPPGNLIGDFAGGGMLLALDVIAALYEREHSGRGQVIDAAMVDGSALFTAFVHGLHAAGAYNQPRGHNILDGAAPFYDTYECADGRYIAVGSVEPQFYARLLETLGIDDAWLPVQLDPACWAEAKDLVAAKFSERPRDEWAALFADSDACVTPVLSPWEAHEHPHHRMRDAFIDVGELRQPAPAPRFSRTPAATPRPHSKDVRELLRNWKIQLPDG